jgi:hypothetical protein
MAKTGKTLNTDLDEAPRKRGRAKKEESADHSDQAGDDVTYNMGDIQVTDTAESEDEDFKKASQKMIVDSDDDNENDWIDEDLNAKDEDIFLDMDQDFDIDNPYSDDEY